jgi:hypothetical protein
MEMAQQKLVCRLKELFPIDTSRHKSICRLKLTTGTGNNEESIPTVLGHVCHFVALASKYLEFIPRYELSYKLSRSMMQDSMNTPAAVWLPLRRKDNDRRRYEQAVGYLISDVKQVLLMMGQEYVLSLPLLQNLQHISPFTL